MRFDPSRPVHRIARDGHYGLCKDRLGPRSQRTMNNEQVTCPGCGQAIRQNLLDTVQMIELAGQPLPEVLRIAAASAASH